MNLHFVFCIRISNHTVVKSGPVINLEMEGKLSLQNDSSDHLIMNPLII